MSKIDHDNDELNDAKLDIVAGGDCNGHGPPALTCQQIDALLKTIDIEYELAGKLQRLTAK